MLNVLSVCKYGQAMEEHGWLIHMLVSHGYLYITIFLGCTHFTFTTQLEAKYCHKIIQEHKANTAFGLHCFVWALLPPRAWVVVPIIALFQLQIVRQPHVTLVLLIQRRRNESSWRGAEFDVIHNRVHSRSYGRDYYLWISYRPWPEAPDEEE